MEIFVTPVREYVKDIWSHLIVVACWQNFENYWAYQIMNEWILFDTGLDFLYSFIMSMILPRLFYRENAAAIQLYLKQFSEERDFQTPAYSVTHP